MDVFHARAGHCQYCICVVFLSFFLELIPPFTPALEDLPCKTRKQTGSAGSYGEASAWSLGSWRSARSATQGP